MSSPASTAPVGVAVMPSFSMSSQHTYILVGADNVQRLAPRFPERSEKSSPTFRAGLIIPAVFIIVMGTYAAHVHGTRTSCWEWVSSLLCGCCRRAPPPPVPLEGALVLVTVHRREHSFRNPKRPDAPLVVVVQNPDKSCHLATPPRPGPAPGAKSTARTYRGKFIICFTWDNY